MENLLSTKTKVRFQDCDPFNHLNNSKYIDYFLNAREDQLIEHYGIDVHELAKTRGISWLVGSSQIMYINPAENMETVLIESQLIKYSAKNLMVELTMWDENRTRIKAVSWIGFVHFNMMQKKSHIHEEKLMSLFEQIHVPIEQDSFEKRGRFLAVKFARPS